MHRPLSSLEALVLVALFAGVGAAACSAAPHQEGPSGAADEALMVCDGPSGALCGSAPHPLFAPVGSYWHDIVGGTTANTCNLASSNTNPFSGLGCTTPILDSSHSSPGFPIFVCPKAQVGNLHPVSWFGLPECPIQDGKAQYPGTACEVVWSSVDASKYQPDPDCDGPLIDKTNNTYVWIDVVVADVISQGGCGADCALPH
jgi:hypothetical protein